MRVAAAHEPLSDEEAPPVEAADLHDVALHTEEGASPPSASNAMFPLHDGGHVVTINVTQYTDQPGSGGVAVAVDVSHGKAAVNKLSGDDDEQEERHGRQPVSSKVRQSRAASTVVAPLQNLSLLEYDFATCGDEWSIVEKRQWAVAVMVHCAWFVLMLFQIDRLDGKVHLPGPFFWIRQAIMVGGLLLLFAAAGLAAAATGVNLAHTRNVCLTALFACVPVTLFLFPHSCATPAATRRAILWTAWTSLIPFYGLIKPVRRQLTLFALAFRAFDRADDRPRTLEWLFLHSVSGLAAVVGTLLLLAGSVPSSPGSVRPVRLMLALIPVIVNGFGDSLARPIGTKFGRHTFRARALWYNGRCCSGQFTRSLEGSLCVLVSGALAVGTFRLFYTTTQFAVAMGALPLALAVVEAVSPVAWDGPIILAVGGAIVLLIERLLPGCGAQCPNRFSLFGIPYVSFGK